MKLNETAFYLLGATVHQGKAELRNLAEDKSFTMEESVCRAAEREICLPSKRVAHELSWLPGVDPAAAAEVAQRALSGAAPLRYRRGEGWVPLPPLALCNVLAAGLSARKAAPVTDETLAQTAFLLRTMAESYEALRAEDVAEALNADREVAGFPALGAAAVQEPLAARRRELVSELADYIFSLPEEVGVGALTEAVTECSRAGAAQNPLLLDELVAAHELHAESTLRLHEMSVRRAAEKWREAEDADAPRCLERLEEKLRMWDALAQPIQLSAKSRGLCHEPSRRLATDLHNLVRELCGRPACAEQAAALSRLLAEVFAEVPEVQDMLLADVAYAATELPAKAQMPAIMQACHAYRPVPRTREELLSRAEACEQRLLKLYAEEELCDAAADWFGLLMMRYAAAMVNVHHDLAAGRALLETAGRYLRSEPLRALWQHNLDTTAKNERTLPLLEKKEQELNAAADERYRQRLARFRRKFVRAWSCVAALLAFSALLACYVSTENYLWNYATGNQQADVYLRYLRDYPQGAHVDEAKTQLSAALRRDLERIESKDCWRAYSLSNVRLRYAHGGLYDPEPVFRSFVSKNPDWERLVLHEQMFPESARLDELQQLKRECAEQELRRIEGPYTKETLENYLENYASSMTLADTEPVVYGDMCARQDAAYFRCYQELYPDGPHRAEVQEKLVSMARKAWAEQRPPYTREGVDQFAKKYPEMPREEMESAVEEWVLQSADLATCRRFYASEMNVTKKRALYNRIVSEEAQLWDKTWSKEQKESRLRELSTDVLAPDIKAKVKEKLDGLYRDYDYVSHLDTKEAYEKYLTLCPKGAQADKARKRLIDLEVAKIAAGEHGDLPASRPVSSSRRGSKASLEVKNDTSYTITVLYSGPDSQKLVIPAHDTRSITLKAGNYRVAVTTEQPRVQPFYGQSDLTAGEYIETFYIRSETVPSYYPSYSSPYRFR